MSLAHLGVGNVYDVLVIGGGFFGLTIAKRCAENHRSVLLVERSADLMTRASYNNQARVHNGYHYPRSVLTALRSRVNFPKFVKEYPDCIFSEFTKIYAIAEQMSKVTASQFRRFMERIGSPIQPADARVRCLFSERISEAFSCIEYVFDAEKLRTIAKNKALESGVRILCSSEVESVSADATGLEISIHSEGENLRVRAALVFNCTYSRINEVLRRSGLQPIPLKHEMTEMCLVEPPCELRHLGITVMCGPFFSIMPFPARGLHSLSHVRFTPHYTWADDSVRSPDPYSVPATQRVRSSFAAMRQDAIRYLPLIAGCTQQGSLWEVKTMLPRSEGDDSRPILFKRLVENARLVNVMGGKIDNVFDALPEVDAVLESAF